MSDMEDTILSAITDEARALAGSRHRLALLFKRAHRLDIGWARAHEAYRLGQTQAREARR